jgi:hypothetical protein
MNIEAMACADVDAEFGRHARAGEAPRIFEIFLKEEVERADHDERRRQPGKSVRARRRSVRRHPFDAGGVAQQRRPAKMVAGRRPDILTGMRGRFGGCRSLDTQALDAKAYSPPSCVSSASAAASPPPARSPVTPSRATSTSSIAALSTTQASRA